VNVLVVNCGSSSLKYQLFDMTDERSLADGIAQRVSVEGGTEANLEHRPAHGQPYQLQAPMPDHRVALRHAVDALTDGHHGVIASLGEIAAVGHRVVHGGEQFAASAVIDDEVEAAIEQFCELAPLHNPANLTGIRACKELLPDVPQVAVFDTAFHQSMPRHAYLYGLPLEIYHQHQVRRYGFHGTSHRYVALRASEYLAAAGIPEQEQKLITCHLGNGCSMTAVRAGKSVDTSMGMTPLEGLLMGTRCGDLDPAIVIYLMERLGMGTDQVDELLNKRSGLLGLSAVGSDMRDIHRAADAGDERGALALEVFCYRVRKYVGAYAAVLGGLHAVVFTGGIGENDSRVRAWCLEGLEHLGLAMDAARNDTPDFQGDIAELGAPHAAARILAIRTDEELMIARDTAALLDHRARH
jgi:acetate kinase